MLGEKIHRFTRLFRGKISWTFFVLSLKDNASNLHDNDVLQVSLNVA